MRKVRKVIDEKMADLPSDVEDRYSKYTKEGTRKKKGVYSKKSAQLHVLTVHLSRRILKFRNEGEVVHEFQKKKRGRNYARKKKKRRRRMLWKKKRLIAISFWCCWHAKRNKKNMEKKNRHKRTFCGL